MVVGNHTGVHLFHSGYILTNKHERFFELFFCFVSFPFLFLGFRGCDVTLSCIYSIVGILRYSRVIEMTTKFPRKKLLRLLGELGIIALAFLASFSIFGMTFYLQHVSCVLPTL